jgi:hypothetical protein
MKFERRTLWVKTVWISPLENSQRKRTSTIPRRIEFISRVIRAAIKFIEIEIRGRSRGNNNATHSHK